MDVEESIEQEVEAGEKEKGWRSMIVSTRVGFFFAWGSQRSSSVYKERVCTLQLTLCPFVDQN
jgi:hypothetical protein